MKVTAIYISPAATAMPISVASVRAISSTGLEGDRYCSGVGTWSHWHGGGRQVTLIEAKVVAILSQSFGITAAQSRRNIVVDGVSLNDLVGVKFKVGEVEMLGVRRCEPCAYLEKMTVPGVAAALKNCGGLRADIVAGGMIRTGDKLQLAW